VRIRSHLLLLVGCVLIPGLIGAGVAIQQVRDGARETALRGLQETVRATALLVDGEVQRSIGALTALGHSSDLASGNFRAVYEQALAINQPPDVWTLALDETGEQVFNTVVPFGTPPPPRAARERVKQVLATNKPLITDVIVGPVTGKPITTIYIPATARAGTRYVVAQAFSVEHWKKRALQPQGRQNWVVGCSTGKGGSFHAAIVPTSCWGQPRDQSSWPLLRRPQAA
jgi:hypothetical protein